MKIDRDTPTLVEVIQIERSNDTYFENIWETFWLSSSQPGSSFHLQTWDKVYSNVKDHDFRLSLATLWEPLVISLKKTSILSLKKHWEVEFILKMISFTKILVYSQFLCYKLRWPLIFLQRHVSKESYKEIGRNWFKMVEIMSFSL